MRCYCCDSEVKIKYDWKANRYYCLDCWKELRYNYHTLLPEISDTVVEDDWERIEYNVYTYTCLNIRRKEE